MDQYAWSTAEAVYYVGLIMTSGAIVSAASFMVVPMLSRKFSERSLLIFAGFLLMAVGRILNIPFLGGSPIQMAELNSMSANYSADANVMNGSSEIKLLGCPVSQEWCRNTPALPMSQFLIGVALASFGFPIAASLVQSIFSKVLGCRKQGVWIGLMDASGCLARIVGPILITTIYSRYGTFYTFGINAITVLLGMIWTWLIRYKADVILSDRI